MDMRLETKQFLVGVAAICAFFCVIGLAGRYDYAEQVCCSMPDHVYEAIVSKIGTRNNIDVSREYMANRDYYDSIPKN
jgi:hypothetical protein